MPIPFNRITFPIQYTNVKKQQINCFSEIEEKKSLEKYIFSKRHESKEIDNEFNNIVLNKYSNNK